MLSFRGLRITFASLMALSFPIPKAAATVLPAEPARGVFVLPCDLLGSDQTINLDQPFQAFFSEKGSKEFLPLADGARPSARWKQQLGLSAQGTMKYRLRLQGSSCFFGKKLEVRQAWASSSQRITLLGQNGELLGQGDIGEIGYEDNKPSWGENLVGFTWPHSADFVDIEYIVTNKYAKDGGSRHPIGISAALVQSTSYKMFGVTTFISFGFLAFAFSYTLSIFLKRPDDRASLWLMLGSFSALMRGLSTHYDFFNSWVFSPPIYAPWFWQIMMKLEYGTVLLGSTAMGMFCFEILNIKFRKIEQVMLTALGVFLLFIALTSAATFTPYLPLYQAWSLLTMIATYLMIFFARRKKRDYSLTIFVAFSILGVGVIHDILDSVGLIHHGFYLVENFTMAFIVVQSFIVASRYDKAYSTARYLSENLRLEVEKQTATITAQKSEIEAVIEASLDLIFTLDGNASMMPPVSPWARKIFAEHGIKDQASFAEIGGKLGLSDEQTSVISTIAICSAGADALNFQLNTGSFPTQGELPGGIPISLAFSPILDPHGTIEKILVSGKNLSSLVAAEKAEEARQMESEVLLSFVAHGRSRTSDALALAKGIHEKEREILKNLGSKDALRSSLVNFMRQLHTYKGVARTLSLHGLSSAIHQAEDRLVAFIKTADFQDSNLRATLHEITKRLHSYQAIMDDAFLKIFHSSEKDLNFNKEFEQDLMNYQSKIDPQAWTELAKKYLSSTRGLIESFRPMGAELSKNLGKPRTHFTVVGEDIFMTSDRAVALRMALPLLIKNSLDHGIELPEERGEKSRELSAIVFTLKQGVLTIEDDGQGVNLGIIAKKAGKTAVTSQEAIALLSSDGFSTAQRVTEISGRGVGIGAALEILKKIFRSCEIHLTEPNPQGQCRLKISVTLED